MKKTLLFLALLSATVPALAATCSGGANCHACKNCNSCKKCAILGGKCSVCSKTFAAPVKKGAVKMSRRVGK